MELREMKLMTSKRNEMINITSRIQEIVLESGLKDGSIIVHVPHTTAAITINENADPDVKTDMLYGLNKIVKDDPNFKHFEGNSDAHIKSSLLGTTLTVLVQNKRLVLGMWQGIYFCEFDGPRQRTLYLGI
jgi:secondary thiamine-phosphate synthase enzyme